MRYIRNCNGIYARYFITDQNTLKNKCLESKVRHTRKIRSMFVYDSKMLDINPILFLAAVVLSTRKR